MTDTSALTLALQQAGMRITPQRTAICELLTVSEEHPTAAMIYDDLKPRFPSMSLATVYNTLDALVEIGAINVLGQAGDDTVHYDADTEPHVNLACLSCNKRKANRSLDESGLVLRRPPARPTFRGALEISLGRRKASWEKFISERYWNVELED